MKKSLHNPFIEHENRKVQEWKNLLIAEPDLLDQAGPSPSGGKSKVIGSWDEIPDAMKIAAPRIDWLAEGIIPRSSVTLIAGEPGSYKSWLALCLLREVSRGGRFLGRHCQSESVLYLDRENPLAVIRERLAVLGVESLANSRIWGGWLHDPPPAIGDARLHQMACDRHPLVIFDSLIRFHNSDENSASEMATVMADLRALANAGATVIVLHHRPKNEASRYRGSSDIAGAVDMGFSVIRDREAGILTLECFKSRFAEEFSISLRPDLSEAGDFVVTEAPDIVAAKNEAEKLASTIRANPGQSQSEVLARSSVPKARGRAMLAQFEGRYWRIERGAHNAKRFYPLDGPEKVEIEI
jgi:hypothetical protein